MLGAFAVVPRIKIHHSKNASPITDIKRRNRLYVTSPKSDEFSRCYKILGISPGCDQEQVRIGYLKQVKKYHPDSGSPDANDEKFKEVEAAYRKLLNKFASERWKKEEGAGEYGLYYKENKEVMEFDIKHTAPQHRQYLSYDGYGSGTPQDREKQYQKFRAATAVQNVYEHRLSKLPQGGDSALLAKDKVNTKKNKSSSEIHRLVEDLIQEAMAKGEFENLPGAGKPLSAKVSNPYVDFVTHKLNEVLIESGFTPEWITLQREISDTIHQLKDALVEKRARYGPVPLTASEAHEWARVLAKLEPEVVKLNKKINDFNLQVPLLEKQMIHFRLEHEANHILKTGKTKSDLPLDECSDVQVESKGTVQNIFTLLDKLFRS